MILLKVDYVFHFANCLSFKKLKVSENWGVIGLELKLINYKYASIQTKIMQTFKI